MSDQPAAPSEQDEQLEQAKAELEQLTPEGYLEIKRYLQAIEDQASLNEAGGIAFCELWGEHGGRINITARAVSPVVALDNLILAVKYAARYNLRPTQQILPTPVPAAQPVEQAPQPVQQSSAQPLIVIEPAKPQPQYVPIGSDAQAYPVASISHEVSTNGTHYLKVITQPGTPYGVYGTSAWPESFPKGFDITAYDDSRPTKKYGPPPDMAYAVIGKVTSKDGKERTKVLHFSPTP